MADENTSITMTPISDRTNPAMAKPRGSLNMPMKENIKASRQSRAAAGAQTSMANGKKQQNESIMDNIARMNPAVPNPLVFRLISIYCCDGTKPCSKA